MNVQERELEVLAQEVKDDHTISIPPMFELYATLFSILMSVMFFIYPQMLYGGDGGTVRVYSNMMHVMPQAAWACSFFTASMLKAIGLLTDKTFMRVLGLILSSVLYIALAVCYSIAFPSIGAITFTCMAVFTIISVPLARHTTIRHKKIGEIT